MLTFGLSLYLCSIGCEQVDSSDTQTPSQQSTGTSQGTFPGPANSNSSTGVVTGSDASTTTGSVSSVIECATWGSTGEDVPDSGPDGGPESGVDLPSDLEVANALAHVHLIVPSEKSAWQCFADEQGNQPCSPAQAQLPFDTYGGYLRFTFNGVLEASYCEATPCEPLRLRRERREIQLSQVSVVDGRRLSFELKLGQDGQWFGRLTKHLVSKAGGDFALGARRSANFLVERVLSESDSG